MLKINGLTKKFQRNGVLFRAVNEIDLTVEQGDLVQIMVVREVARQRF